ncbi:protein FAR-RED IMPAIRED RESPONSE 1-like [Rhododendron vialii]|uniref:protein FAR-RED IMPAIRED RESPONSE 1-like n=1 Tax=Rhododendron vialii TaxID=182163 RepID=UPI00265EF7E7|nr:protein FAR-RED IMPAIRED RESPONSE 1-like [Rhododendron vialii]
MEFQNPSPEINEDIKAISIMDCEDLVSEEDQNLEEVPEPKVGMFFDSKDDARDYYGRYAKVQGFVVVTRTSNKRRNGQKTNITYSCHRGGKSRDKGLNPLKAHPTSKTDCKASMNLSLKIDGKWLLNSIELKHNHEMCPKKARYLQANRVIPLHAKRTIELNRSAGIKMNQTIASCTIEVGGPSKLPWLPKDARNYADKVRRSELKEGDAESMHKYFIKMKTDNEAFFMQLI